MSKLSPRVRRKRAKRVDAEMRKRTTPLPGIEINFDELASNFEEGKWWMWDKPEMCAEAKCSLEESEDYLQANYVEHAIADIMAKRVIVSPPVMIVADQRDGYFVPRVFSFKNEADRRKSLDIAELRKMHG